MERRGIVREQHDGARFVAIREGALDVLAGTRLDEIAVRVVDAREVERRLALADRDALVAQRPPAALGHARDPRVGARVEVVVARHEEDAVARAQLAQRLHLRADARDAAVHEIAGHCDEVRVEPVHDPGDRRGEAAVEQRADVHVRDLRDAEAVERRGPARQRDLDALHAGRREPAAQRDGRQRQRDTRRP